MLEKFLQKVFNYSLFLTLSIASFAMDSSFLESPKGSPQLLPHKGSNQLLQGLSDEIGYQFKDVNYLILALTRHNLDIGHTYSSRGYERLEFLGDAVLEYAMRAILWSNFPHSFATLPMACESLVNKQSLSYISKKLKLAEISKECRLSSLNPHKINDHTQGDFVESLIGALYFDGGLEACSLFIEKFWIKDQPSNPIYEILLSLQRDKSDQDTLGYSFQKHSVTGELPFEFLGTGILKFTLCEMLYRRFPELNEGDLTKKMAVLSSSSTLFKVVEGYGLQDYIKIKNGTIKSLIGLFYFDGGLQAAQDFIRWHWTGSIIPSIAEVLLKKDKNSPVSLSLVTFVPSVVNWVSWKNLLQELLIIVEDKADYNIEKFGEENKLNFKTTLTSKWIGEIFATDITKKKSEQLAARIAFNQLALNVINSAEQSQQFSHYMRNTRISDKYLEFYLKVIECKLIDLGVSNFSYHQLAYKKHSEGTTHRIEIQGDKLIPAIVEGRSILFAKVHAALAAHEGLVQNELEKINFCTEGEVLDINETHLAFYKSLYEERLRLIHSKMGARSFFYGFQGSLAPQTDEFKYRPIAKMERKNGDGYVLTYSVKNYGLEVKGKGMTALQAQLIALTNLLEAYKKSFGRMMFD